MKTRVTTILAAVLTLSAGVAHAARLEPESVRGWSWYIAAAGARMARELGAGDRFLVLDFAGDADAERRALRRGELVIRPLSAIDQAGHAIQVQSASIHHWRGAVFIPGVSVEGLVRQLETTAPPARDDVLESRVLARGPNHLKVFLKLQSSGVVTVTYDTEHDVTFRTYDAMHATSASVATRIAELARAGVPGERELPPGEDHGFLWRLNAYWRYEQVAGGVIAECESITLSRGVPLPLRVLLGPLVDRASRGAMARTLESLRVRFARPVSLPHAVRP